MKNIVLTFISALVFISYLNAQQKGAHISFEKEVHDFGKIKEDGGKVEYRFMFTNTGDSPLIITNVKASCGCTAPTWTEKPVMPGQKGYVNAVFDPRNRPGNFNKSIMVQSNSANARNLLRITGEVLPREKTVEDYYPKQIDELRLQTNHFAFVKVYSNEIKKDTLKIYNASATDLELTFGRVPEYIKLTTIPKVLRPGEKGIIVGEYDGKKANDWGFISSRLDVLINGKKASGYFVVSARVEEDFSNYSAQDLANAPKITFDNTTFDFGKTNSNDPIEHQFKLTNNGKSDLIIRKIRATCGCTTVAPEKTVIKPGESTSFKAIFNPGGRKGMQRKSIYVISNDPKNSNVRLMITGEIIN